MMGMPLAFAYPRTRRLKRPAIRIRCALTITEEGLEKWLVMR